MAAIREWYAVYGIMFNYLRKLGGEEGLRDYENMLGEKLAGLVGPGRGAQALEPVKEFFDKNTVKDGGVCHTALTGGRLEAEMALCPDHLYFSEAPYDTHKFGPEYCDRCKAVYQSLASHMGLRLTHQGPQVDADGRYSCRFTFAPAEETP